MRAFAWMVGSRINTVAANSDSVAPPLQGGWMLLGCGTPGLRYAPPRAIKLRAFSPLRFIFGNYQIVGWGPSE